VIEFGFTGIFFEVQLVNAHAAGDAIGHVQVKVAALADGFVELGDLVALGQIGVKVVLAIKVRNRVDLRMHRGCQQRALVDGFAVQNGQHTGHAGANRANIAIWGGFPRVGLAGAEDLGLGVELDVGFEPDDDFVIFHFATSWRRITGRTARQASPWVACSKA